MKNILPFNRYINLILLSCLIISGCQNIPNSIRGTTDTPQQNFPLVQSSPSTFMNQEIRFGGKVVSVKNNPKMTELEITSMPLDSDAKPILGAPSQGRFIAYVKQLLDPLDYTNHYITVVGYITGNKLGKIGNAPYNFVKIDVTGFQRWNLSQQIMVPPVFWNDGWSYPYYSPADWEYTYGPVDVQPVLTQ